MINWVGLERGLVGVGAIFFARIVGGWRAARKQRAALVTPLVDAAVLEAVFQPRPADGDDPDLLAELRDTFAHLNRQAYAEEFWGLHAQISALDATLGASQKATLRRALLRLLDSGDRWLQRVAARTSADLGFHEAVPSLRALLDGQEADDPRFRSVLEEALTTLDTAPAREA